MESVIDIMSSVIGSFCLVYTGQPFDTVKVRMQVQPSAFKGPLLCLTKTIQEDGVRALWRGAFPATVGACCENVVAFGVYVLSLLLSLFYFNLLT